MAAAIKAGFYSVGIGAGVEQMTTDGMSWKGSVNPKVMESQEAQDCLLPMGDSCLHIWFTLFGASNQPSQAGITRAHLSGNAMKLTAG